MAIFEGEEEEAQFIDRLVASSGKFAIEPTANFSIQDWRKR